MLAAGCGTIAVRTQPSGDALTAAVTKTGTQTAQIAASLSVKSGGMSFSFAMTGAFDFAHSRGTLTMPAPIGLTELLIPPNAYLKVSSGGVLGSGTGLPRGKSWIEIPGTVPAGTSDPYGAFATVGNVKDLLTMLSAVAGSERNLGASTVRGVPVTGYQVNVDLAKAASAVPAQDRAGLEQYSKSLPKGTIPLDFWVDGQDQLRRIQLSLRIPGGSASLGISGNPQLTVTIDFFDFGAPVNVSAPPASQVASMSQMISSGIASSSGSISGTISGTSGSGLARPPAAAGSLTAAQATAAEQAVSAFWAALGRNDMAAVARTVIPSQRSCVTSFLGSGMKFTVSSFRIVSARPAGSGRATIRFTVKAAVAVGGQQIPMDPARTGVQWFVATQQAGRWYVDPSDTSGAGIPGCLSSVSPMSPSLASPAVSPVFPPPSAVAG